MGISCENYCNKGMCSNCGNCCTELLPLTMTEVKLIKAYIKEKKIKPYSPTVGKSKGEYFVNLQCPFRDFTKKNCMIYEVRPKICRLFKCNQDESTIKVHKDNCHKRAQYNKCKDLKKPLVKLYSMRELIYGDPLDTILILIGHLFRENYSVSPEKLKSMLHSFERDDLANNELITKALDIYNTIKEDKNV